MNPKDRIAALEAECARLRAENESLRTILKASKIVRAAPPQVREEQSEQGSVRHESPTSEKVALFRSLFRGREDIYPLRWESKTGRSGYSPACANEWISGVCEKPRIKCSECPNKAFLPVSDDAIYAHLSGDRILGVYPILQDDTCWFIAADFDGTSWREDAMAYAIACQELDIPACLEVSRSRDGAHVWIFFANPIPAGQARQLASAAITRACARHRTLAFASYDRLFPSQDTLLRGGFGNLIALPLQRNARDRGASVFVDDAWRPYSDQWAFLARIKRMTSTAVELALARASREDGVLGVRSVSLVEDAIDDPWTLPPSRRRSDPDLVGPFPDRVDVVSANMLFIGKDSLSERLINRLYRLAAFQNPELNRCGSLRSASNGSSDVRKSSRTELYASPDICRLTALANRVLERINSVTILRVANG